MNTLRRKLRKLHLWLIAHGVEFEHGDIYHVIHHKPCAGKIAHRVSIVVNHRYFGIAFAFDIWRSVYADELDVPHAEIAAGIEQRDAEKRSAQ